MARLISLMGLDSVDVPGVTVNRFCSSGLETIGMAAAKIQAGMAECIIAGGSESMSSVPMTGYKPELNYNTIKSGHADYYWGMGNTAEAVANQFNISREDQDEFAYQSHIKALKALSENRFQDQIAPIKVEETYLDSNGKKVDRNYTVNKDEGPREGTSIQALAKLRAVFAAGGSVTAGNSSQMSDGAAFVMVMSEEMVKELKPLAYFRGFTTMGCEPDEMGIGPVFSVPKLLNSHNMSVEDVDLWELNEAFASQSLACIKDFDLNQEIINVNGGAIALGHPVGATGAKLSVQLFDEMRKRDMKYRLWYGNYVRRYWSRRCRYIRIFKLNNEMKSKNNLIKGGAGQAINRS